MSISCCVCSLTGAGAGVDGNGGLGEGVELLETVEDEGIEEMNDDDCSAALGISGLRGELGRAVVEVLVNEIVRERMGGCTWAGRKL